MIEKQNYTSLKLSEITGKNHSSIIVRDIKKEISEVFGNETLMQVIENKDVANLQHTVYQLFTPMYDNRNRISYFIMTKNGWLQMGARYDAKTRFTIINYADKIENKINDLEYITPKQAALAYEYINFFKYVENQKQVYLQHQKKFVDSAPKSKYVYSEFAKYRAQIIGWDKKKVDAALKEYLKTHAGHNFVKLMRQSMSDKLSIIDINEAIRVSVLDLLFSKGTDTELANKFANMVKNVSKEMEVLAFKKNETNLFQKKENFNIKAIE